jgi:release factor glutamine methyltransferase
MIASGAVPAATSGLGAALAATSGLGAALAATSGTSRLRHAVDRAAVALAAAGIAAPRVDAEELAAYLAGIDRGRLFLPASPGDPASPGEEFFARYDELVAARSRRIPLQHLIGTAPFGPLLLQVGPGVFIPRPETESLLEWASAQALPDNPVIVDVCTGSGALALALSRIWPAARVIGIDDCADALGYARRNTSDTRVELLCADATEPGLLTELDGGVDLVVANPPYIPAGTVLEPEVAEHDPQHALFGGPDGMVVVGAVVGLAERWLRPGGWCAVEHDDTTSAATVECFLSTGAFDDIPVFDEVEARRDLAGRPRFVTARRKGRG